MPLKSTWQGEVKLPQATIALRMELDFTGNGGAGSFIVGKERTAIPELSRNGDVISLDFSEYGGEMTGTWDGARLVGEYVRKRTTGAKAFPFEAMPVTGERRSTVSNTPLGEFRVEFPDEKNADANTVARIWRDGDSTYGTLIAPDGDFGLFEGSANNNGTRFSRFTGWQAMAVVLDQQADGSWSGTVHSMAYDAPKRIVLHPQAIPATTPNPAKQTSLKNPAQPFAFECKSLSGETVRNTDAQFKGKALAIDIMGTWCHNCMDESPVLQELQDRYASQGFEVVGLSFEILDDEELGRKNLTMYRDRFHLTYPLLYCGSADDPIVDRKIKSQLDNFFAYPTTLFADKNGRVRHVHIGFRGPGTGDLFPLQVEKLHELAAEVAKPN